MDIGQDRSVSFLQRRILGEHVAGAVKLLIAGGILADDQQIAHRHIILVQAGLHIKQAAENIRCLDHLFQILK